MAILEIIASSLSAIASIRITLDREATHRTRQDQRLIETLILSLQRELAGEQRSASDAERLRAYDTLLNALRGNAEYMSRLEFQRTEYGTLRLLRKRKGGKRTILRDPEAEYGNVPDEEVIIDEEGNPRKLRPQDESEMRSRPGARDQKPLPAYPAACRCKDHIDIREVIAFQTVIELIERRRSLKPIRWLDMCCGQGNILTQARSVLGQSCSHVEYHGIDLDLTHINECQRIIRSQNLEEYFAAARVEVHDIMKPLDAREQRKFDIVTLLNVLHEIPPFQMYAVLKNALDMCKYSGLVLIIDMCSLPHLEWQAITYPREYLQGLVSPLLKRTAALPVTRNPVTIGIYQRRVDVLALRLRKSAVAKRRLPASRRALDKSKLQLAIKDFLANKKRSLSKEIKAICGHNATSLAGLSPKDWTTLSSSDQRLLMEYWAVSDALAGK